MAVNKVEYKLASTTEGFAQAGDTVQIKTSNAKTIQKDVDEGCTENLSNATQRFLDIRVKHSTEETDYESDGTATDETIEDGGDDIAAEKEGEESKDKGTSVNPGAIAGLMFGQAALMATSALHFPVMNAFTAPAIGAVETKISILSIAMAAMFDSEYNERMSEAAASNEYISELQEYEEIMNADIESMASAMDELEAADEAEESEEENAESNLEEGAADSTSELESLQTELEQANANGDAEKAAEIQAKIDELSTNVSEGTEDTEDQTESIIMNNESAHIAAEISTEKASFLHQGKQLGAMGLMNAAQLAGCAVNSGLMASEAWIGVNPFLPFTFANASVGTALSAAAAAKFTVANLMMTVKSAKEFNAASKGSDISNELANIQDPLQQHDKLVESLMAKNEETSSDEEGAGNASDNGGSIDGSIAGNTTSQSGSTTTNSQSGSSSSGGGGSSGSSSSGSGSSSGSSSSGGGSSSSSSSSTSS